MIELPTIKAETVTLHIVIFGWSYTEDHFHGGLPDDCPVAYWIVVSSYKRLNKFMESCIYNMLVYFKLDATKRTINFVGKKNSNFFALFSAKLISYRRCNQEKGYEGSRREVCFSSK